MYLRQAGEGGGGRTRAENKAQGGGTTGGVTREGCGVCLTKHPFFPLPAQPISPPGSRPGPQASSPAYSSLVQLLGLSIR